MPHAAHDALGLFDNTALGWTVETPRAEPQPAIPTSTEPNTESAPEEPAPPVRGKNFYLEGDRSLARGWTARARDNIAAVRLSTKSSRVPCGVLLVRSSPVATQQTTATGFVSVNGGIRHRRLPPEIRSELKHPSALPGQQLGFRNALARVTPGWQRVRASSAICTI